MDQQTIPFSVSFEAQKVLQDIAAKTGGKPRFAVVGNGCSGISYAVAPDVVDELDSEFALDGCNVLIDAFSLHYMDKAFIATDDLGRLTVSNPQVVTTCGCPSSF